MRKYSKILFCTAHPTKNAGNLREYFIENSENFSTFHFFPGYANSPTYFEKYKNGKKISKIVFDYYKGKNLLVKNLMDFIYFSFVLLFKIERSTFLLINAPFFCLFNSFFRIIKSHKYVLWIGDYYPQMSFPMNIYNKLVSYYSETFKYVIFLSPPLMKIYSRRKNNDKFRKVISLGINSESRKVHAIKSSKIRIGFIGIIREQQGLDLLFEYLKNDKNCMLEVVGDGYDLESYKKLARETGISDKVKFYGRVDEVSKIFEGWDVGVAPYVNSPDNLSKYCEPTKIKNYLSYNLPVITTKTTYFYKEIEKYNAGEIIDENVKSLRIALGKIKKNYNSYQKGVSLLREKYEYNKWYDEHLTFLE